MSQPFQVPGKALSQDVSGAQANTDYAATVRAGLWLLIFGFGGFLAWATLAPLDEGIPAPGRVSVESMKKRIDHNGGGIIEKILVHEGQIVKRGQDLIAFNETQAKAALNATLSQWYSGLAMEARLNAERTGAKTVTFPPELSKAAAGDSEVAAMTKAQVELFRSRSGALSGELAIIRESVLGLEAQIRSLDQLKTGREKQLQLFSEQLASFTKLRAQGFVSRNQLLDMERQYSEVQSKQSEDLANIAGINARLAEYRMRGAQRQIEYRREVETQLTELKREISTLSERLAAQRDFFARLTLQSPVEGMVMDIAFHTVGGTIKPGDRIMDIVPVNDALIFEAQLPPQYIDRVHPELEAQVLLDAFMSRADQPTVTGKVSVVSADILTDSMTGQRYYALRITVSGEEIKKLRGLQLRPGMQGTVMVKTGERSFMAYLLRPLLRRFSTALGEA